MKEKRKINKGFTQHLILSKNPSKLSAGFTLIELLVAISIISVLSSVVLASVNDAKIKARDAVRMHNIAVLKTVIEAYHADYGVYPTTNVAAGVNNTPKFKKISECSGLAGTQSADYIPLVRSSGYISKLPSDPLLNCTEGSVTHSWSYSSNGVDYKLITHPEGKVNSASAFVDYKNEDATYPYPCTASTDTWEEHLSVYFLGAKCWNI